MDFCSWLSYSHREQQATDFGDQQVSTAFDTNEYRSHLLVQQLKHKADQAWAAQDRAACERWLFQLMDVLDTLSPEAT